MFAQYGSAFSEIADANMIRIVSRAGVANKTWNKTAFASTQMSEAFLLLIFILKDVKGVVLRGCYRRMIGTKFKPKLNLKGFWGHTVYFGQMYLISWAVFGNSVQYLFWSMIRPAAILTCQTVEKLNQKKTQSKPNKDIKDIGPSG